MVFEKCLCLSPAVSLSGQIKRRQTETRRKETTSSIDECVSKENKIMCKRIRNEEIQEINKYQSIINDEKIVYSLGHEPCSREIESIAMFPR